MNLFCWFSFHNGKEQVWKAILRWGPIQTALTCSNFSEFKYKSTFDPFQGFRPPAGCQRSPLFHKQLWSVTFWGKLAVMKSDHLRFLSHKIEVWARLTVSSRTTYQSRICETCNICVSCIPNNNCTDSVLVGRPLPELLSVRKWYHDLLLWSPPLKLNIGK